MSASGLVVAPGSPLHEALLELARDGRLVFVAGLPGTGKSLLIHQLARLAHDSGRRIHLLQWDVARPPFESSPLGRPYPQQHGVTHAVIRMAVGRWARDAVVRWDGAHPGGEHLLIGETPLVGHRLLELARPADDAAEPLLAAPSTRFVVPVPSREVRRHLERERERRARAPLHPRETEDAPPAVLRDLWRALASVARELGIADLAPAPGREVPYDPLVYQRVYERILRRRRVRALPVDTVFPTGGFSAYDLGVPAEELTPDADAVARSIRAVEVTHPNPGTARREVERWYAEP